jgi:hypothetical protein
MGWRKIMPIAIKLEVVVKIYQLKAAIEVPPQFLK